MSPPHLRLFGCPELLDPDGVPVPFRTHKHLALLVYLALEARDRVIPRDFLIDLLWSNAPYARGRHSLAQALSAIRGRVGPDLLSRGGRTVQILGNLTTDIDRMEANGESPNVLGQPLDGLDHLGGPTFAHWVDLTRARLRLIAREHLSSQLESARSSGDGRRVHERAVLLYRVDPLSDTAVEALCERLLNDGEPAAAARLLRDHVERIESQTGLPAPHGLKRLQLLLECGHLATQRLDRRARSAWQHRPPEIFVGREVELSRLETHWSATVHGNRRMCLVTGATGIGKSSLLSRFSTSLVARSATVCAVVCQEIGQNIPFAAVADFIIALARFPGTGGLEGRWLAEASRVAPGVRRWWDGIPDPPPVPADAVRLRVAETLVRMIDAACEGEPMVLVLDDLGYLDPASRDILHLLSRRLRDSALLILASARTIEEARLSTRDPGRDVGLAWDDIVALDPLEPDHVRRMVANLCEDGGPLDTRTLHAVVELAQGNPYLVEMLLSDWRRQPEESLVAAHVRGDVTATRWRPPTTMQRVFERQHRGLSAEAERVLNLLAVAGRRLSTDDIRRLLRFDEATADGAYIQLLDRGVLRVEDGSLSFKNQVHRSFVYDAMAEGTRRLLHGKLGTMLARAPSAPEFQDQLGASHHFMRAAMPRQAVKAAVSGANEATDRGGASEAEHVLRSVLPISEEHEQSTLGLLLGRALAAQGKHGLALPILESLSPADLTAHQTSMLALTRAEVLHRARLASDEEIEAAINLALSLSTETRNDLHIIRAAQLSAEFKSESGETLDSPLGIANAVAERTLDIEVKAFANLTTGYCALMSGDCRGAGKHFASASSTFLQTCRDIERRRALNGLAISQLAAGEFVQARRSFETAARTAERTGDLEGASNSWSNLGALLDDLGRPREAAASYEEAMKSVLQTGNVRRLGEIAINVAGLALTVGDFSCADRLLQTALALASDSGQWRLLVDALYACADLKVGLGHLREAWALVEKAESLRDRRTYLLSDMGRVERLRRYHLWHTRGYDALNSFKNEGAKCDPCIQIADRLEVEALEEWINWVHGRLNPRDAESTRRLWSMNLTGIAAWLDRLGTLVPVDTSESQQVARTHRPDPDVVGIASAKCRLLAEQLRSGRTRRQALDRTGCQSTASTPPELRQT